MILRRNRNLILPGRFRQRGTIGHFQSVIAASRAMGEVRRLNTTITSARAKVEETVTTTSPTSVTVDVDAEGFDVGADYYANAVGDYSQPFGSIAAAVYTDADSNSRTISSVYRIDTPDAAYDENIFLTIEGASVPNTDATFLKIVIGAVTYTRASVAQYYSSVDTATGTSWRWSGVTDDGVLHPTGNPWTFEVWVL